MTPSAHGRWLWPVVGLLALLAVAGAAVAFVVSGMRMYVVQTPSMGTGAPVGALVVTTPAQVSDVAVGDIVAFQQPGDVKPHTHRVKAIDGDVLRTRGDINGADDPLPVGDSSLIGRAVIAAPVLGWAVKMLPIVLIVTVIGTLLTVRVGNPLERFRYRVLAAFCGLAIAIAYVKPMLGAALLWMRVDSGGADPQATARVVSTGLLPIRVMPLDDGGHASGVLSPTGTTGEAVATKLGADGRFAFYPQPALDFWWWVGIIVFCLLPVFVLGLHAFLHRNDPLWLGAAEGTVAGAAGDGAAEVQKADVEATHSAHGPNAQPDAVRSWVNQGGDK